MEITRMTGGTISFDGTTWLDVGGSSQTDPGTGDDLPDNVIDLKNQLAHEKLKKAMGDLEFTKEVPLVILYLDDRDGGGDSGGH